MGLFDSVRLRSFRQGIFAEPIGNLLEQEILVVADSATLESIDRRSFSKRPEYLVVKADETFIGVIRYSLMKHIYRGMSSRERNQITFLDVLFDCGSFDVYPTHSLRKIYSVLNWYQNIMQGHLILTQKNEIIGVIPESKLVRLVKRYQVAKASYEAAEISPEAS